MLVFIDISPVLHVRWTFCQRKYVYSFTSYSFFLFLHTHTSICIYIHLPKHILEIRNHHLVAKERRKSPREAALNLLSDVYLSFWHDCTIRSPRKFWARPPFCSTGTQARVIFLSTVLYPNLISETRQVHNSSRHSLSTYLVVSSRTSDKCVLWLSKRTCRTSQSKERLRTQQCLYTTCPVERPVDEALRKGNSYLLGERLPWGEVMLEGDERTNRSLWGRPSRARRPQSGNSINKGRGIKCQGKGKQQNFYVPRQKSMPYRK